MNTLGSFIESEAFFPILIILLLLLIGVFIWVVFSNKKQEKMYREKKQNIQIDESAQIKIVDQGGHDVVDDKPEEEMELSSRNEIAIIEVDSQEKDNIFDEEDLAMQEYKKEMQEQNNDIMVPDMFIDENEEDTIEIPQAKEEKQKLSEEDKKIIEAFELPNFNSEEEISDEKLEQEIIEAANQYISSIMHKTDEKEEDINGKEN